MRVVGLRNAPSTQPPHPINVLISITRLRVAAIDFLNPAPLMWNFEHAPANRALARQYQLAYMQPSACAAALLAGEADLGLVPIAALTPDLAIVPGCTIASLHQVRSIQLIVKQPHTLATVQTVAADSASRSSLAYAKVLFRKFLGTAPVFLSAAADPITMLRRADAALLIGDPALLALESRAQIEQAVGPCTWFDIAEQWRDHTNLPWVAAVWAIRPQALSDAGISSHQLIADLQASRDCGLAHIEDLVQEWTPRIALPPSVIRHYLTENIHYHLDPDCLAAIDRFRCYAAETGVLPPLGPLNFLH